MSIRQHNTLNIYSATASSSPWWRIKPKRFVPISCFFFFILTTKRLLRSSIAYDVREGNFARPSSRNDQCWLKRAIKSGECALFSHRSYYDNTQSEQPSCHDALVQLKGIGVNHLDLDLVLDEQHSIKSSESEAEPRLVVAHPMEFKQTSNYYSPCANTELDEMVHTLKKVYGTDFFLSMEPKAAWGNTQKELEDKALTNLPSAILDEFLRAIRRNELEGHCAAIVEISEAQDDKELEKELALLKEILEYCQLFRGIRITDKPPQSMGDYDIIMPTIEFHPSHAHNVKGQSIPKELWNKSIFWVVDSVEDLHLAADMRPYGIVSNSPKNIVDILEEEEWCKETTAAT